MSECLFIDPLVTPYVDGGLAPAERQLVDGHLRWCAPCQARVATERAVRELLAARKPTLRAGGVSSALRTRCEGLKSRAMAAELTADHVKCFAMNGVFGARGDAAAVEQSMLSGFGWRIRAAERFEDVGLRLVGSRSCLYGAGKVAHIMYRHDGHPVSVVHALQSDPGRRAH